MKTYTSYRSIRYIDCVVNEFYWFCGTLDYTHKSTRTHYLIANDAIKSNLFKELFS